MKISEKYRGAFLCDGLGKTFIGMMLIDRKRKRVALFVPKAAGKAVWKPALRKYLPNLFGRFSNLEIFSHTDLSRERLQEDLQSVKERADVVIIDEAHNFRNPGLKGTNTRAASRCYRMAEIIGQKKVFLLTATPINNSLIDLQRLIELFTQKENNYFKNIGVHSLPAHFRALEKQLGDSIPNNSTNQPIFDFNQVEAEQILSSDELFRELVVQRSRSYVRESQKLQGGSQAKFPKREVPQVAEYSIKKLTVNCSIPSAKLFPRKNRFSRWRFTVRHLFRKLCASGAELVRFHLLEGTNAPDDWKLHQNGSAMFANTTVASGFPKKELADIDENGKGRVYINKTTYFDSISEEVWNFHIGGYQVCHKWLKDRKDRELSVENIEHYGKIIVALGETIHLMAKIDEIIEEHGGFPLAGSQNS